MTETETRCTIAQFIAQHHLRMTVEWTDTNPNFENSRDMDHWKVVIRCGRRTLTIYFSQGRGHNGEEPKLTSVLSCLASDSSGFENARGFEEWAGEYGYSTDSRSAEKTYKVCERQATKLKNLLGVDAYQQLLWNTESE